MIGERDASLHTPSTASPAWAETNYWGFFVPEANLMVNVYALFRTNQGVVQTMVAMNTRWATTVWEGDYWDFCAHNPIPPGFDMLDYRLASGLRVKAIEPNRIYRIGFDDGDGTSFDVEYRTLMDPFDIHDPDQDPMAGEAWGDAYNGHFDQTGTFTGEVNLRGRRFPVNCVSTWDHSWGIRPERHRSALSWLHAHFSEDLAVHAMFDYPPANRAEKMALSHGYILENGKVHGLKAGTGTTVNRGWYPYEKRFEVTDSSDRTWIFSGQALNSFPLQAWPDIVFFDALMRWEAPGGEVGYGETMDFFAVCDLTDEQAERGPGPW